ncbi:hypothetical protein GEV33_000228 [Tenebrio molitor]|uniref:Uncharacterized protein n=1 Tax=Tenebrio molitor TaxID=7067 RepID=A0A8J6LKP9_TENMO|nr:hypothetical protein GEV33_000228 [Tenebrio molitor]
METCVILFRGRPGVQETSVSGGVTAVCVVFPMISLKVEVSLFAPSPEIEDRNEVDAGYWANKMQGLCYGVETSRVRESEAGRRVEGVQTQTSRSGFANARRKIRGELNAECGVRFHARISSSTAGPRNVQVSRDVDRPVTIKARVIE